MTFMSFRGAPRRRSTLVRAGDVPAAGAGLARHLPGTIPRRVKRAGCPRPHRVKWDDGGADAAPPAANPAWSAADLAERRARG